MGKHSLKSSTMQTFKGKVLAGMKDSGLGSQTGKLGELSYLEGIGTREYVWIDGNGTGRLACCMALVKGLAGGHTRCTAFSCTDRTCSVFEAKQGSKDFGG